MSSDVVLEVEGASKCYRTFDSPRHRLAELLGFSQPAAPVFAVQDVSFSLKRGEILGLIGPNGAGKSTLLQLIAGTLQPSFGRIALQGRVTALLELGAGVDPELSGRENIFLMGGTYGLDHKTIQARLDDIVAFSGLGDAIDKPVKVYSSGMFLRLAFSVSTALEPDLLIIDEALAVGDVGFQARCLDRLEQLIDGGASIVLASHDIQLIRNYCTSAICMDGGRVVAAGDPELVTERYYYLMRARSQFADDALVWNAEIDRGDIRFSTRKGAIDAVEIGHSGSGDQIAAGNVLTVSVAGRVKQDGIEPSVVAVLRDARGYNLYGLVACAGQGQLKMDASGAFACCFHIPLNVAPGQYSLTVRLEERRSDAVVTVLDKHVGVCRFTVHSPHRTFLGAVNLFGSVEPLSPAHARVGTVEMMK